MRDNDLTALHVWVTVSNAVAMPLYYRGMNVEHIRVMTHDNIVEPELFSVQHHLYDLSMERALPKGQRKIHVV